MFVCSCRVAALSVCVLDYFASMAPCLLSPSFLRLMYVGGSGKGPGEGAEDAMGNAVHSWEGVEDRAGGGGGGFRFKRLAGSSCVYFL